MLVLCAHGYSLPRSEPILVANKSDKFSSLPLSNARNRTQIGSEVARNNHFKIVSEQTLDHPVLATVYAARSQFPTLHLQ